MPKCWFNMGQTRSFDMFRTSAISLTWTRIWLRWHCHVELGTECLQDPRLNRHFSRLKRQRSTNYGFEQKRTRRGMAAGRVVASRRIWSRVLLNDPSSISKFGSADLMGRKVGTARRRSDLPSIHPSIHPGHGTSTWALHFRAQKRNGQSTYWCIKIATFADHVVHLVDGSVILK